MRRKSNFAFCLIFLVVATLTTGCGGDSGGSGSPPVRPPPITVGITTDTDLVPAGGTAHLLAGLTNDSSLAGVTWTLSPASGAGTLSNSTGTSVTYNGPADPPPDDVVLTVTATSKADPSVSAAIILTLQALGVSVEPSSAPVGAGGTQLLVATVVSDPSNQGVTWTINPASGAGTLSGVTATSVTYNAPATPPPSDVPVTITATSKANPARSGMAAIAFAAIQVLIDPASATLMATDKQPFTAQLAYDPAPSGVTWSLSPASGAGTLSDVTTASVTYNAPATPPSADQLVTLTATDIADPAISGSAPITVRAIAISVSPNNALIPLGATQSFTTTVDNDPSNAGATWSLSQSGSYCAPACGVLTPVDAVTVTYRAPAAMPANPAVTFTATSVTNTTKFTSAPITLTAGSVQLAPNDLAFGYVPYKKIGLTEYGAKKAADIALINKGTGALNISGLAFSGANPQKFTQHNTCATSVAGGAACVITVTFLSTTTGAFTANLDISDDSPGSPQRVTLSATACKDNCPVAAAARAVLAATNKIAAPVPSGSNRVGTRTVTMTDAARSDPYRKDGSKRELLVRFWYPASASRGCPRAQYTAPEVWSYFGELIGVRPPAVTTNSCQNAQVLEGTHPVVVFTHGYTGTFTDYTFLFEDLASRGYIVASVNHTYEATATAFPGGRFEKSVFGSHLKKILRTDPQALSFAMAARLRDLKFVADELDRLNRSAGSPLAGHLDLANLAVAGHSLGGLTALEMLHQDARFHAAVTIDGVAPDSSFEPTLKPVLIVDAGHDHWADDERQFWAKLQGPRFAVNFKHAQHVAPSDAVWLERGAVKTGRMTPEQIVAATRAYIAAFLDSVLQGTPAEPLLTRPSAQYPEAELTTTPR